MNTDTLTFKYFIATVRLQTLANILMVTALDFNLAQCDLNCATMLVWKIPLFGLKYPTDKSLRAYPMI